MSVRQVLVDLVVLTKPRIILLLSLTGLVALYIPNQGAVSFLDAFVFFLIGYFSSGGAMVVNNYIDRDIDVMMHRTKNRPSITTIDPTPVLTYGLLLMVTSFVLALVYFNWVVTVLLIWADAFYIFGYSLWLKRTSYWSTIVSSVISPTPVYVGYAATTGTVPIEGWLLGGIVLIWTIPHTFTMAAKNYEDYKAAGIPMMPVVMGMKTTAKHTLWWGLGTVIYTTAIYFVFFHKNGLVASTVLVVAITLFYIWTLVKFYLDPSVKNALISFRGGHTLYLAGIFILTIIQNYT